MNAIINPHMIAASHALKDLYKRKVKEEGEEKQLLLTYNTQGEKHNGVVSMDN